MHESIQNLMSDSNISSFEVPVFQRAYSWTKENAETLFNDVLETQESERKSLLGLLVLIVPENDESIRQIVDGQQRLTTITILLSILRSKISDIPVQDLSQRDQQDKFGEISTLQKCLFREARNGSTKPLLQFHSSTELHQKFMAGLVCIALDLENTDIPGLSHAEQHALEIHLKSSSSTAEGHAKWMSDRTLFNQTKARSQNARKNFDELNNLIDEKLSHLAGDTEKLKWLIGLSRVIRDSLSIIKYETRNFEDAFVLFETLNDRGMAVAASDLIKNFCLQSDADNVDQIGTVWSEIFQEILPSPPVNPIYFLRTYNNSCSEFVTKKNLFRRYKSKLENNDLSASAWLNTVLRPEAIRFRSIVEDLNGLPPYTEFINIVFALDSTDSRQWHSIALSSLRLMDQYGQSATVRRQLVGFLNEVFKATVVLEAKGLRGSTIEKKFPEYAVKIHALVRIDDERTVVSELEKLNQRFVTFRRDEGLNASGLTDILVSKNFSNKTAKTILTSIRLADVQHGSRLTKLTIEHICPQKPDFNIHWSHWDIESHEENVQKLGNLLCLNGSSNATASNGEFALKKELYASIQAPDMLPAHSNLHFNNLSEWTPLIVEQRTKEVAARLVDLLE